LADGEGTWRVLYTFLDQEEPVVFKLFDWQMVKVLGMNSSRFSRRRNLSFANYLLGRLLRYSACTVHFS
jgi:hypothetical protein